MTADDPTGRPPAAVPPDALAERILAAVRATGPGPLVVLDHDGVLAPIAPTPAAAAVPPDARAALAALAERTAVAVLSGRGLADLVTRLGDLPVTLVAEHGLRARRPDGTVVPLAEAIDPTALDRLRAGLAELLTGRAGWLIEDKGVGVAVHHRRVDRAEVAATLPAVRALLEAAATAGGGRVQDGHEVVELRAAGADKGAGLRWLLAQHPGRGVVMVGDDRTDEPALATAEAVGGTGVVVAATPRPSAASVRLADPAAVTRLLAALAAGLRR